MRKWEVLWEDYEDKVDWEKAIIKYLCSDFGTDLYFWDDGDVTTMQYNTRPQDMSDVVAVVRCPGISNIYSEQYEEGFKYDEKKGVWIDEATGEEIGEGLQDIIVWLGENGFLHEEIEDLQEEVKDQFIEWMREKDVLPFGSVKGESDYYVVEGQKEAIFHKNGKQISDWFDFVSICGLVKGQSDYYIAMNDGKQAIFRKDGKQISEWVDRIWFDGLVKGESDYYIAIKEGKQAIFRKDGKQISEWFDEIYVEGLVKGESDYYIAENNDKKAIFDKDGNQVSKWFDCIYTYGLVKGESDYYIVAKDGKQAIFRKDGKQISEWFDWIYPDGLVSGQSDYYIAGKGWKQAIFDKDGNQISDWFAWIPAKGLVKGDSDFYIAESYADRNDEKYAVYHVNGEKVLDIEDFDFSKAEYYIKEAKVEYYLEEAERKYDKGLDL